MAVKAPDAFRTISEVADWLDIPAHVLRFWESKFAQIKPVKRAGGRRYYRPADMELIGGIKKLLHDDGMTIRGVQKLITDNGIKHISCMSQPLDMPSDAEAAERRAARRSRRKERTQKAKGRLILSPDATAATPADEHAVAATDPVEAPEPVAEAPKAEPVVETTLEDATVEQAPSEETVAAEAPAEDSTVEEVPEAPFIDVPEDTTVGGDNVVAMTSSETPKASPPDIPEPDEAKIGLSQSQAAALAQRSAVRTGEAMDHVPDDAIAAARDKLKALRDKVAASLQSD